MKIIERKDYLDTMIKVIKPIDIKVITGIRRSGKSKLLLLFKKYLEGKKYNVIFIDFNNSDFDDLKNAKKLESFIESKYKENKENFVLVDEVQLCEGFEKAIISLHVKEKYHIYITGSNAFLLSSDLATLFTGRAFEIEVYPFSFKEYLQYFKHNDIDEAFDKYVFEGGFSGSYLYEDLQNKYSYINKEILETIIVKDICKKYKIKNIQIIKSLCSYMLDNASNLTSANSITNYLSSHKNKVTNKTISNYIDYLCKSFLFYKIDKYDIKGKKYLNQTHKFYLCDHSLKYARLGTKNLDIGRTYENIVAIELLRRKYDVYVGQLYNGEIDFVASKQNEKIYIQVCKSLDDTKTLEREVKPLLSIKDAYPKIIITRSKLQEYSYEGIKIIDITDWLINY